MERRVRIALAALLVASGAFLALVFATLLGISDCSATCEERGERAPAIALIGAGAGLVLGGIVLSKRSGTDALGSGLLLTASVATLVGIVYAARGAYAYGGWTLAAGLVAAIAGGGILKRSH